MYIAAFLSLGNHLSAQNWSIGPIAGVNVTNIDIDAPEGQNFESRPGFAGGLVVNYSDIEHFGASVNFLFSQYGGQVDGTDSKTRLNYFQVPLYAVWYFNELEDNFRPKIYAGPYLGFLLAAKDESGRDLNPTGEAFNDVDAGITAGLGFNYRMARGLWLNFDLRYNHGLANISAIDAVDAHNRGFGAMLGVAFSLTPEE